MPHVRVKRAFWLHGQVQAVGSVVEVDLPLAIEMQGSGKAEIVAEPVPESHPDESVTTEPEVQPAKRGRAKKDTTA